MAQGVGPRKLAEGFAKRESANENGLLRPFRKARHRAGIEKMSGTLSFVIGVGCGIVAAVALASAGGELLDLVVMRNGFQLLTRVQRPVPYKSIALPPRERPVEIPLTPQIDQPDAIQSGVGQVNPGQVLSVMRGAQLDNLSANIVQ